MVRNMNSYFEQYGIRYINELRMGIGIPDITLNMGANTRICKFDDFVKMEIISYINEKKETTFSELSDKFYIEDNKIRKIILEFEELAIVKVVKSIIKIIKNILETKLGVTISIEAKLRDWKGGLLQAERYLCFSDYSYLALPADKIRNVDINQFIDKGIGLLSVEGNMITEILSPIKSTTCKYKIKYLATSEVLKKYGNITGKRRRKDKVFFEYAL